MSERLLLGPGALGRRGAAAELAPGHRLRDLGYAAGALLAGIIADAFGLRAALWTVAALTGSSGPVSAFRMSETLRHGEEDNVT